MLKKMLGIALSAALGMTMIAGCASEQPADDTNDTAVEANSLGAFDSDQEKATAKDLVIAALADKTEWVMPENEDNFHLSKVVDANGKVFYDCLVFADDGESNAYVAVDADGNVHAMDIDREVVVDYSPEFLAALSSAAEGAEDMTYNDGEALDEEPAPGDDDPRANMPEDEVIEGSAN